LRLDSPTAAELKDLEATARQLERFEESGLLNQVVLGRLRSALEIRRRRLRRGEPEPSARPRSDTEEIVPANPVMEARLVAGPPGQGPAADEPVDVIVVEEPALLP